MSDNRLLFWLGFGLCFVVSAGRLCGQENPARRTADQIAALSNVRSGVIIHYGCGDGRLTAALSQSAASVVQGLSRDANQVGQIRDRLAAQKLPGNVTVQHWQEDFLPYADNMVNLFVADGSEIPPMTEIMRVLTPLGVACIKHDDGWRKIVKPWPDEIDEWTHWCHAADGNPVAKDEMVGSPRAIQWIASPRWPKSHDTSPSLTGMVTAQGRLFYIADTGPAGICDQNHELERWHLCARDAFNGVLLWKKPIEDWGNRAWSPGIYSWSKRGSSHSGGGPWISNPRVIHKRLVAQGNHVYVTLGFRAPVFCLNARSGDVLRTYKGTEFTSEIVLHNGVLFLVVDQAAQQSGKYLEQPDKCVVALNPESGSILWKKGGFHGVVDGKVRAFTGTITRLNLTVGAGKVFVYDQDAIVALDVRTGDPCWSVSVESRESKAPDIWRATDWVSDLMVSDDVLYSYQQIEDKRLRIEVQAFSTTDGSRLWQKTCGGAGFRSMVSIYKAQGLVWVLSDTENRPVNQRTYNLLGLDPRTGKVTKTFDIQNIMISEHHHRCYRNKATENYIIYSRNGLEFADLRSGEINNNRWVRGICGYGIMPANGLVYVPPQPCICFANAMTGGFVAYASQNQTVPHRVPDGQRLQKGRAYGTEIVAPKLTDMDWKMYRHDAHRSGSTPVQLPEGLETAWIRDLKEPITATTVGWGKVFLAGSRTCRVMALDSQTGRISWAVPADHRVDTPPTLYRGKVFFGTTGGYVYCLRATDGALVWRFNANPMYRTIIVHGNMESAWPVHGSVVVNEDVVYFAAGRSTYVDGGLRFYALDARTGEQRLFTRQDTADEGINESGATVLGTHNDLLIHDGSNLYLKNMRIDPSTLSTQVFSWPYVPFIKGRWEPKFTGTPLAVLGGGFLDDSFYDRSAYVLNQRQSARKLVFNNDIMIGMRWSEFQKGRLLLHEGLFEVERDHYTVFAKKRDTGDGLASHSGRIMNDDLWAQEVPVRVEAMSLAGDTVFIGGPPMSGNESSTPDFVLRSLNGQEGGILMKLNGKDGVASETCKLPSTPVWDGIAISNDGLFVALRDGKVVKLGAVSPALQTDTNLSISSTKDTTTTKNLASSVIVGSH